MSDELMSLRLRKNISTKDIITVAQKLYPSFDKTLLSKVSHADKYGIVLRRDALDALIDEFAPEAKPAVKRQRNGRHRLTRRIACRLTDEVADELQQQIQADGYKTTQDWLDDVVQQYLASKKS